MVPELCRVGEDVGAGAGRDPRPGRDRGRRTCARSPCPGPGSHPPDGPLRKLRAHASLLGAPPWPHPLGGPPPRQPPAGSDPLRAAPPVRVPRADAAGNRAKSPSVPAQRKVAGRPHRPEYGPPGGGVRGLLRQARVHHSFARLVGPEDRRRRVPGLHPPRGGFEAIKKSYGLGGTLGFRGEDIKNLLVRMV